MDTEDIGEGEAEHRERTELEEGSARNGPGAKVGAVVSHKLLFCKKRAPRWGRLRVGSGWVDGLEEAGGFVPTIHQVETLDGLAGGAFDEIVLCAEDEHSPSARVEAEGDVAEVCPSDVLGIGEAGGGEDANEGAVGVGVLPSGFEGGRGGG